MQPAYLVPLPRFFRPSSDGPQSLDFPTFQALMRDLPPLAAAVGRRLGNT
jgi:hypothetical protein